MMFSLSLLSLPLLPYALAAPQPVPHADPIHIPILRRSITPEDRIASLPHVMDSIRLKYGFKPVNHKRSTTSTSLTDELNDSSYSAVVDIGTPPRFCLVLQLFLNPPLGSSDLWVATNECLTCTSDVPLFNTAKSSTYKNGTSTLQITYGSGDVAGYVSQDTVTFSGFTVQNQQLLSVAATSSGLLNDTLSGIMGLGFESISALQTTPLWQSLYNQNMLSSPVFAFYLERYVNQAQSISAAPGGTFTLGGTNTSLYTGNIEFINMPSGTTPSYWLQQVKSVTVQGKSITVSSSNGLAAIDTGTTLIGAPSTVTQEFWASVPGSVALGQQNQGLYAFPCSTSISVSLSFGGTNWAISPADMNLGEVPVGTGSTSMCAGGLFDIGNTVGNGQGLPAWIVGDTFLKNVYSVFQANPPAVGFAQLANGLSSNTSSGSSPLPSGSSSSSGSSNVSPSMSLSMSLSLIMSLLAGFFITL
ncbi:aspartic peptidase domain-containing protein [Lanmaoa asiatica]|nr:aspartic peptidase domain-containing protein [Lanmaoa asiatica]